MREKLEKSKTICQYHPFSIYDIVEEKHRDNDLSNDQMYNFNLAKYLFEEKNNKIWKRTNLRTLEDFQIHGHARAFVIFGQRCIKKNKLEGKESESSTESCTHDN